MKTYCKTTFANSASRSAWAIMPGLSLHMRSSVMLCHAEARLGPPVEPARRLNRREKATAIAEAAANRWDAFHDRNGVNWLVESILGAQTEDDERVVAWANRSVREVQDSALAEVDRTTKPRRFANIRIQDGPVLWWALTGSPLKPFVGSPTEEGWSARYRHWTALPEVREP